MTLSRRGTGFVAFVYVRRAVAAALLIHLMIGVAYASESSPICFATGPDGGTYQSIGEAIRQVLLAREYDVELKLVPTGGSVENTELLASGQVAFGLVQSDVLASFLEIGETRGDEPKLQTVLVLSVEPVHIVTGQALATSGVHGLTGRAIVLGPAGSGSAFTAQRVLNCFGIENVNPVSCKSVADATTRLVDGEAVAAFFVGTMPYPQVATLLQIPAYRLLQLAGDESEAIHLSSSLYETCVLPAHTYPNQEEPIYTVSVATLLVCRSDTEKALVEAVCKAIVLDVSTRRSVVRRAQPAILVERLIAPLGKNRASLHPGAQEALSRIPWRIRARDYLRWSSWGFLTLSILMITLLASLRAARLKAVFGLINATPLSIRKHLKSALLSDVFWRVIRAVSFLLLMWLIGTALMFRQEHLNNSAFSDLRTTALTVSLYIFSGAQGALPVTATGWFVLVMMLAAGLGVVAYLTGEFASDIIKRALGGATMRKNAARHSILILGWNSGGERVVKEFLSSFEDGMQESRITVLSEREVDEKLRADYTPLGVTFLAGKCVDKDTLSQIGAAEARCVVVMAQEGLERPDHHSALVILGLRTLLAQRGIPRKDQPKVCAVSRLFDNVIFWTR